MASGGLRSESPVPGGDNSEEMEHGGDKEEKIDEGGGPSASPLTMFGQRKLSLKSRIKGLWKNKVRFIFTTNRV